MLIKSEAETDPSHGHKPLDRPIKTYLEFGFVNLDKPSGPTSHQVADWVKKILNASKCGHSGTLDPHVTGVLPSAVNSATKVLQSLLPAGKEYVGVMHVHKTVKEKSIKRIAKSFVGRINQLPPVKSAVKRQWRKRRIYEFEILEVEGKDVLFRASVQAGTYIRKLCHDFGQKIGGAHMAELRRTRAGPFLEKDSKTLQELADAAAIFQEEGKEELLREVVLPVEAAVTHLKKIEVKDGAVEALCCGANLAAAGISRLDDNIAKDELIALMSLKGELVTLANAMMTSKEILAAKQGWTADIKRVIMAQETYPRMWKKHEKVKN